MRAKPNRGANGPPMKQQAHSCQLFSEIEDTWHARENDAMDPSLSDKKNRTCCVNGLYISSGPNQMFDCERNENLASLGGEGR
jgi:hypothetical protein